MQTAIDSSVLFSIFKGEPNAGDWVARLVGERGRRQLVICDIVFAEIATLFPHLQEMESALLTLGIRLDPIQSEAAHLAGQAFADYRRQGGPRQQLIPDFLIGAHALKQASALMTRDRGYLRRYFRALQLIPGSP